jgi:putative tryptophan/tyrosine transport system substrate-binding protein
MPEMQVNDIQIAVQASDSRSLNASALRDTDAAFARLAQVHADALLVAADPIFFNRVSQLVVLATRHVIPALYSRREFVAVSYGSTADETNRTSGVYAGRILKGEKPGDPPILQPTKFRAHHQSQDCPESGSDGSTNAECRC